MMKLLIAFIGLLVLCLVAADKKSDVEAETRMLQGKWKLVEVQDAGKKIKPEDPTTVTIKGEKYIEQGKNLETGKLEDLEMTYKLDVKMDPKTIEVFIDGTSGGTLIYKVKGNKLTTARFFTNDSSPKGKAPPLPKNFSDDNPKYNLNIRFYEKE